MTKVIEELNGKNRNNGPEQRSIGAIPLLQLGRPEGSAGLIQS
jgi:hypothetical protein